MKGIPPSSVDDELSYLDLDTGRVTYSKRSTDNITLSSAQFDATISKLSILEKSCNKLEQLDKLDTIEANVSTLTNNVSKLEKRLTDNERKMSEMEKSVAFVSERYDSVSSKFEEIKVVEKAVQNSRSENAELRR